MDEGPATLSDNLRAGSTVDRLFRRMQEMVCAPSRCGLSAPGMQVQRGRAFSRMLQATTQAVNEVETYRRGDGRAVDRRLQVLARRVQVEREDQSLRTHLHRCVARLRAQPAPGQHVHLDRCLCELQGDSCVCMGWRGGPLPPVSLPPGYGQLSAVAQMAAWVTAVCTAVDGIQCFDADDEELEEQPSAETKGKEEGMEVSKLTVAGELFVVDLTLTQPRSSGADVSVSVECVFIHDDSEVRHHSICAQLAPIVSAQCARCLVALLRHRLHLERTIEAFSSGGASSEASGVESMSDGSKAYSTLYDAVHNAMKAAAKHLGKGDVTHVFTGVEWRLDDGLALTFMGPCTVTKQTRQWTLWFQPSRPIKVESISESKQTQQDTAWYAIKPLLGNTTVAPAVTGGTVSNVLIPSGAVSPSEPRWVSALTKRLLAVAAAMLESR